ncbi:hypothetical protein DV736_g582, partial [Chaetothyriales sp. CBS 134916]
MNQNQLPYGQQVPLQPPHRRHDGSYGPIPPPHLRPHPAYPPYYAQQMAPMLPQYPQHFAQNCSSTPIHTPIRPSQAPLNRCTTRLLPIRRSRHRCRHPFMQKPLPSSASTASTAPIQAPPSPPLSTSTTVSARKEAPGHSESASAVPAQIAPSSAAAEPRPFVPPTPWLSFEGDAFPPRAPPQHRRIPRSRLATVPVVFPATNPTQLSPDAAKIPTTPISSLPASTAKSQQTPTLPKSKPVGPVVPVVPVLSQNPASIRRTHDSNSASKQLAPPTVTSVAETATTKQEDGSATLSQDPVEAPIPAAALPPKPTSWANLFRPPPAAASTTAPLTVSNVNGVATARGETLTEVLNDMHVPNDGPRRLCFLQPRGLVNTGNMCYMNSVLQVLVFCTPFYDFLSKIARRAAHTFKSDTPLIDAIILFMQEYPVLESGPSAEQLRRCLKPDDYDKYGDPFVPEYVYSAITPLPRFREMRRGHQQDAQEFLGLLLEELHEECSRAMRSGTSTSSGRTSPVGSAASAQGHADNDSGWMEVGHKQKPAVTRSSGTIAADSPVTNIFGGKLRSELKVAGNRLSVTLEPYSPLQLDIGSPEVSNIIDALKGLTKPESMQGEFQTSRGQRSTATKQVFIETLPPVLILHLKRFQYDHTTKRAEKIWKKVGYPLDLEIPKEILPIAVRNKLATHGGLPRYRLAAVIYHHGKNANGGHYTVDIRRQDGKQWIRMDDTLIRRVSSEDVAECGSEEDPKVLAAALERHKQGKNPANRFEQIEQADEEADGHADRAWNQVNGHSRSKSTASAVVNGAATPVKSSGPHTPREKLSVKDNKTSFNSNESQPLLTLFTSQYPLAGSLINGSIYAYRTTQAYIPGAEWTGRNVAGPIAGTVARIPGLEDGLRWYLQPKKDTKDNAAGRPLTPDLEKAQALEFHSPDSLPAYDEGGRSPPYTEHQIALQTQPRDPPGWRQQLVISSSGLGVAMSDESLRSLRFCLQWLRWANGRLGEAIHSLKVLLNSYGSVDNPTQSPLQDDRERIQAAMTVRIATLKNDVLQTIKQVVDIVSRYAGGALPENARNLVHRHLTSLPQRFTIANAHSADEENNNETEKAAGRVMLLATEGLDMMTQVSRVVNDTLVSAEGWCERLGKRAVTDRRPLSMSQKPEEQEQGRDFTNASQRNITADGDVKMEM